MPGRPTTTPFMARPLHGVPIDAPVPTMGRRRMRLSSVTSWWTLPRSAGTQSMTSLKAAEYTRPNDEADTSRRAATAQATDGKGVSR